MTVTLHTHFAPGWHFNEKHETTVFTPPAQAYQAVKAVTAREIFLFRTLVWMRRAGRRGPPSILNPPPDESLLNVALRTGFVLLDEDPDRELVIGMAVIRPRHVPAPTTPEAFHAFDGPGIAKATLNFLLTPDGLHTIVRTETRVHATDIRSRKRFGHYWMLIAPGSGFIRRMWLKAIKERAEG